MSGVMTGTLRSGRIVERLHENRAAADLDRILRGADDGRANAFVGRFDAWSPGRDAAQDRLRELRAEIAETLALAAVDIFRHAAGKGDRCGSAGSSSSGRAAAARPCRRSSSGSKWLRRDARPCARPFSGDLRQPASHPFRAQGRPRRQSGGRPPRCAPPGPRCRKRRSARRHRPRSFRRVRPPRRWRSSTCRRRGRCSSPARLRGSSARRRPNRKRRAWSRARRRH